MVLRFAGPHLAEQTDDDLLPVTLAARRPHARRRALLGDSRRIWRRFDADSPFAGLDDPDDVTVSRQVLAEPSLDLAGKTWARLTDGTPLVTAEKRGKGWLVLVHTTADPEWSIARRSPVSSSTCSGAIVALSQGVAGGHATRPLPPVETLDGFGRLQRRAGERAAHRRRRLRRDAGHRAASAGLLRHRRCAPRPQPRQRGEEPHAPDAPPPTLRR